MTTNQHSWANANFYLCTNARTNASIELNKNAECVTRCIYFTVLILSKTL